MFLLVCFTIYLSHLRLVALSQVERLESVCYGSMAADKDDVDMVVWDVGAFS